MEEFQNVESPNTSLQYVRSTQYKTISSQPVHIIAHSLLIIATCNY